MIDDTPFRKTYDLELRLGKPNPHLKSIWKIYDEIPVENIQEQIAFLKAQLDVLEAEADSSEPARRKRQRSTMVAHLGEQLALNMIRIAQEARIARKNGASRTGKMLSNTEIEHQLKQALISAEKFGSPMAESLALRHLSSFYARLDKPDFESSILFLLQAVPAAGFVGPIELHILFMSLTMRLEHSDVGYVDALASLYTCWSFFGEEPLENLIKRAQRLKKLGLGRELKGELRLRADRKTCWHIGRAVAAAYVLDQPKRVETLLKQGKKLAGELDDRIWLQQFEQGIPFWLQY